MFDFHLHSNISHDSDCPAEKIIKAAENIGLREICFTDHYDYFADINQESKLFYLNHYNDTYNNVSSDKLKIRRGIEFSLTHANAPILAELLKTQDFDFVIGSVHFIDSGDPYRELFWQDKSVEQAIDLYLQDMYRYVKSHNDFDVLGHLTYISKCPPNPAPKPILYKNYADVFDEIFKDLIQKGKGLEVNTSAIDSCGVFLPDKEFLKRFKDLGGKIITVGSDSHNEKRVGQYTTEALEMIKKVFGHVCTYENRNPVFHKL